VNKIAGAKLVDAQSGKPQTPTTITKVQVLPVTRGQPICGDDEAIGGC